MIGLHTFAFIGLIGLGCSLFWVLPMINMHMALNNEAHLIEQAQSILDSKRFNKTSAKTDIFNLQIPGIDINSVNSVNDKGFEIIQIEFRHNGFFYNKLMNRAELEELKTINILTDQL